MNNELEHPLCEYVWSFAVRENRIRSEKPGVQIKIRRRIDFMLKFAQENQYNVPVNDIYLLGLGTLVVRSTMHLLVDAKIAKPIGSGRHMYYEFVDPNIFLSTNAK